jgi:hypothetical protein
METKAMADIRTAYAFQKSGISQRLDRLEGWIDSIFIFGDLGVL